MVDIFWLVVGGGGLWWIYFGWWWVMVDGGEWRHSLVRPFKQCTFHVFTFRMSHKNEAILTIPVNIPAVIELQ